MKTITLYVLGEKFEISLEEEFFEYSKEDLITLQKISSPKELLFFVLEKDKKLYELLKRLEKLNEN